MQVKLTEISTLVIGMASEAQRNEHMQNLCLGLQGKFIKKVPIVNGYPETKRFQLNDFCAIDSIIFRLQPKPALVD
jgi:hypothetical protein